MMWRRIAKTLPMTAHVNKMKNLNVRIQKMNRGSIYSHVNKVKSIQIDKVKRVPLHIARYSGTMIGEVVCGVSSRIFGPIFKGSLQIIDVVVSEGISVTKFICLFFIGSVVLIKCWILYEGK